MTWLRVMPGWDDSKSPLSCSRVFICGLPTMATLTVPVTPLAAGLAGAAGAVVAAAAAVVGAPAAVVGLAAAGAAGAVVAALPTALVYIFLGCFFIRGLLAGSVKG